MINDESLKKLIARVGDLYALNASPYLADNMLEIVLIWASMVPSTPNACQHFFLFVEDKLVNHEGVLRSVTSPWLNEASPALQGREGSRTSSLR